MADGVSTQPTREDIQRRILEGQIERCREELRKAAHFAQACDLEAARRRFDRVRALVKESRIPADVLVELKESIRRIEVMGLKKLVDQLLERAMECARSDDVAGRASAIKEAREHITRAAVLSGEPAFKDLCEKKIETAMLTQSRQATAAPKENAAGAAAPRAAWNRAEKAAVAREGRRFKRFTTPPLTVDIDGRKFQTVNWSIGGLALPAWPEDWDGKQRFTVSYGVEGDPVRFSESAELIRVFPDSRMASVKFESTHSEILKLIQRLTGQGHAPQE